MRHKRRTCARLCHSAGGELEQIQFLLGHGTIQTTERYLGCKQRIRAAVNDRIGIEPEGCEGRRRPSCRLYINGVSQSRCRVGSLDRKEVSRFGELLRTSLSRESEIAVF